MKNYIIKNANVMNPVSENGKTELSIEFKDYLFINDGKFVDEESFKNDVDYEEIDCNGCIVLPGLIDCHVHYGGVYESGDKDWVCENDFEQMLRAAEQCRQSLRHGFTTVRDISRYGIYLRNSIEQGFMYGPTIVPCGRGLTRSGGHADSNLFPQDFVKEHHPWGIIADGEEEVRKACRLVLREGSECIKLWASGGGINQWERETDTHFTAKEIEVMVEEAKDRKVPVAAHCENKESIMRCIQAGVNSIEHGEEFDDEVAEWYKEYLKKQAALPEEERNPEITLVPTIGLYIDWYEEFDPPKERDLTGCEGNTLGEKEIFRIRKSFNTARSLGIPIAVGADSFCTKLNPYGMYTMNEMYELEKAGMTKEEVIIAATINGARCLKVDDRKGSIEHGKDADLIITNCNTFDSLQQLINYDSFKTILKGGEIVDFNKMAPMDMVTIEAKKERLRTGKISK